MRFALTSRQDIGDGRVFDVITALLNVHEDGSIPCPDDAEIGWVYLGGGFSPKQRFLTPPAEIE